MVEESYHWADEAADRVIQEKGDKERYVCASGISPSGTVHIGNFREIITTDFIVKALERKGKKVRFIYSWDDFDRFRKVPENVPKEFEKYIGMALCDVPDPFNCHKNYALHFEDELEKSIKDLGFEIGFIRQGVKYKNCDYSEDIKKVLNNKEKIRKILDRYRTEPLEKNWIPLFVFCEKCKKDSTKILNYDGQYGVEYKCDCGFRDRIDFRKKGIVSLPWRVDWPMRWNYEKVDFEPGGKDHSVKGGSFDTGKQIVKEIWNREAPTYQMYDFIRIKGKGGKISSSLGNVITPKEMLSIYQSEIMKCLFSDTRPNSEFAISFDTDVLKIYSDFDKTERIYFGKEEISESKLKREKRIYELCMVNVPKKILVQPSFRHLTVLLQIYNDVSKILKYYKVENKFDVERVKERSLCALNWLEKYAPEDMKFKLQEKVSVKVSEKERRAVKLLSESLKKKELDEKSLFEEFYKIIEKSGVEGKDFFSLVYKILIGKEKGPKLAPFILIVGKEKICELLDRV